MTIQEKLREIKSIVEKDSKNKKNWELYQDLFKVLQISNKHNLEITCTQKKIMK